jgi:hypothetical protein
MHHYSDQQILAQIKAAVMREGFMMEKGVS